MANPVKTFEDEISEVLSVVHDALLNKNRAYSDAARPPVRIFSGADDEEKINVRIDDELSMLSRGEGGDDLVLTLIEHLVLKRIFRNRKRDEEIRARSPRRR